MVLYRKQWPVNFILHSAELHIGSSVRYENALYRNYFLNCYIVKIILISFNCFSEYSLRNNIALNACCKYLNALLTAFILEANTMYPDLNAPLFVYQGRGGGHCFWCRFCQCWHWYDTFLCARYPKDQWMDTTFGHDEDFFIPPANFVCRGYTVFTLSVRPSVRPSVRASVRPSVRPSVTIFIKPCKHVHICKTNTLDKKVRARGQFY